MPTLALASLLAGVQAAFAGALPVARPLPAVDNPAAPRTALPTVSARARGCVVFWQPGFPSRDGAAPQRASLERALAGFASRFVGADGLAGSLAAGPDLLVLPYGSAFPRGQWEAIKGYLQRGGNLLALGGRPFFAPVDAGGVEETPVFSKELAILDASQADGARARGLRQVAAPDFDFLDLPALRARRVFELTVRLSEQALSTRMGALGRVDGRRGALVYGASGDGRLITAPATFIDHVGGRYWGGRWVLASFEPEPGFWDSADGGQAIQRLADFAALGVVSLDARPTLAVFRPGETPALALSIEAPRRTLPGLEIILESRDDGRSSRVGSATAAPNGQWEAVAPLPSAQARGFHEVLVTALKGGRVLARRRAGYWVEDASVLAGGVPFSAGRTYLRRGGRAFPVFGTTSMASDVHRYFLQRPNAAVFERDMAQLEGAGFNMIRTGVWAGWDVLAQPDGAPTERALRGAEAFLLSARRHGLAVQFNLFSFAPEVFGGQNPYLDGRALARQRRWAAGFASRFRGDADVIFDLINEPSFSNPGRIFDGNVPNRDPLEIRAWSEWLLKRYGSRQAVARAWGEPEQDLGPGPNVPLPNEWELRVPWDGLYPDTNNNPRKAYDYNLFAQEKFKAWSDSLGAAVRAASGGALVTVGQDSGGNANRLLNWFFGDAVDFTATHLWLGSDTVVSDVIASKTPGKPNLVQELGVIRREAPDEGLRLGPAANAALLERKLAAALGAGAGGAIQWLWNSDDLLADNTEASIGALRDDGTEKPEADVLRSMAAFARKAFPLFEEPRPAQVVLMLPQTLQLTTFHELANEAVAKAVRALEYEARVPVAAAAESDIGKTKGAKLIVAPSPQALSDAGWRGLLDAATEGATVLIDGPAERDEHWRARARVGGLKPDWRSRALWERLAFWGGERPFSYGRRLDRLDLEELSGASQRLAVLPRGKGRLVLCPFPAELNEDASALAELYARALSLAGVARAFETDLADPAVLLRRTEFPAAVLYLALSESSADRMFTFKEPGWDKPVAVSLPAGRSRLLLLDKATGRLLTEYAPPTL